MASWRRSVSPYSGGTVPALHRSSLTARRLPGKSTIVSGGFSRARSRRRAGGHAAALARLGGGRVAPRAGRARPAGGPGAAAALLDEQLGDWRPLLERFAADRAPVYFRTRAETAGQLRRLQAAGARIGAFTDAPRELADIALAHVGAARRIVAVGTLDEVLQALGDGTVVVRTREELTQVAAV